MKKLLAAILLTAGLGMGQVSLGIRIGPPPAPRVVRVRPVAPGPGYFWVDGYWYPAGNRYRWHEGFGAAAVRRLPLDRAALRRRKFLPDTGTAVGLPRPRHR